MSTRTIILYRKLEVMKKTNCTGRCDYNREKDICNGCNRTLEDIKKWSSFTLEERQEILDNGK